MTPYAPLDTSGFVRRSRRLIEIRNRHGLRYLMSWVLLEPVAVKPNTRAKRRNWRRGC